jgi:hypothetical protein
LEGRGGGEAQGVADPKRGTYAWGPIFSSTNQGCQLAFFQTKIPIWVTFGGSYNERCWYILCPFGILCRFYRHWVYFSQFWYVVAREIWHPCYGVLVRKSTHSVSTSAWEWCPDLLNSTEKPQETSALRWDAIRRRPGADLMNQFRPEVLSEMLQNQRWW